MDTFTIRRAWLRSLIDLSYGGSVSDFATKLGYSRSQVSQYLSSTYNDGRSIGERVARSIEQKAGMPAGWLDRPLNEEEFTGHNQAFSASDGFPMVEDPTASPLLIRNLEVTGTLLAIGEEMVEVRPNDEKKYLEFHSRDASAYALLVKGNNLRPRVKSSEFLILEPATIPLPGDDVLIRLADGEWLISQFLFAKGDEFTLQDINERGPTVLIFDYDIISVCTISAIVRSANIKSNAESQRKEIN